jgi:hypothetical protein
MSPATSPSNVASEQFPGGPQLPPAPDAPALPAVPPVPAPLPPVPEAPPVPALLPPAPEAPADPAAPLVPASLPPAPNAPTVPPFPLPPTPADPTLPACPTAPADPVAPPDAASTASQLHGSKLRPSSAQACTPAPPRGQGQLRCSLGVQRTDPASSRPPSADVRRDVLRDEHAAISASVTTHNRTGLVLLSCCRFPWGDCFRSCRCDMRLGTTSETHRPPLPPTRGLTSGRDRRPD